MAALLGATWLVGLAGCGVAQVGSEGLSLQVRPSNVQLAPGGSELFAASAVAGVVWSVVEASGGRIDASGLYTAPAVVGDFHVMATVPGAADLSATAVIHVVTAGSTVAISPAQAYLRVGQTIAFTASLSGTPGATFDWSVQEGSGGTISGAGVYQAPATPGAYHVVAAVRGDPSRSAVVPVTVSAAPAGLTPLPVISRNAPAFSSGAYYGNAAVDDASYTTTWFANSSPSWVALDLSRVPAAQRQTVVVAWYNSATTDYDASVLGGATYSLPGDYAIEASAAAGGGSPPSVNDASWVTLASVTGNQLNSRQHAVNLAGRNWIRMRITADCSRNAGTTTSALNLDVHDAHLGLLDDDWLFVGDSITAGAWKPGQFAQLVNAHSSAYFPVAENAGIGYQTAASTVPHLAGWLAHFPGRFVPLSLGTNDANTNPLSAAQLNAFYASYETMVKAVLAAGKTPVIPTIIASPSAQIAANLPALNARLAALKAAYPAVVSGPDLYAAFLGHSELFADGIHPNATGYAVLRQAWADAMLQAVYP